MTFANRARVIVTRAVELAILDGCALGYTAATTRLVEAVLEQVQDMICKAVGVGYEPGGAADQVALPVNEVRIILGLTGELTPYQVLTAMRSLTAEARLLDTLAGIVGVDRSKKGWIYVVGARLIEVIRLGLDAERARGGA